MLTLATEMSSQPDPWVTGAMCVIVVITLVILLLHDWSNDE